MTQKKRCRDSNPEIPDSKGLQRAFYPYIWWFIVHIVHLWRNICQANPFFPWIPPHLHHNCTTNCTNGWRLA